MDEIPQQQTFKLPSVDSRSLRKQLLSSNNFEPTRSKENPMVRPAGFEEKAAFICYFCGGKNCKKEIAAFNPHKNAIEGLHSDWITDDILAMQRPGAELIKKIQLVEQFHMHNIGGILNLQQQGEHGSCGPDLIPGIGLTYDPDVFMQKGINYTNYGWVDMEITTFETLMKVCSAFDLVRSQGKKVAVHCHAGTGRTGVAICSWLIYGERMTADNAIKLFQSKRASSLGKSEQRQLLKDFEKYLIAHRGQFNISIETLLSSQHKTLVGIMKNKCKYLPATQYTILTRIHYLFTNKIITSSQIEEAFLNAAQFNTNFIQNLDQHIWIFNSQNLNTLCQSLLYLYENMQSQIISEYTLNSIIKKYDQQKELDFKTFMVSCGDVLKPYQFQIISSLVRLLKLTNIDSRILINRLSISLLKKQKTLDYCFFDNKFIDVPINLLSVQQLSRIITQWLENETEQYTLFEQSPFQLQFFRSITQ